MHATRDKPCVVKARPIPRWRLESSPARVAENSGVTTREHFEVHDAVRELSERYGAASSVDAEVPRLGTGGSAADSASGPMSRTVISTPLILSIVVTTDPFSRDHLKVAVPNGPPL